MTAAAEQSGALLRTTEQTQARVETAFASTDRLIRDARRLHESAWRIRLRAQATRDWARAVRGDGRILGSPSAPSGPFIRFDLVGELGGDPVWARWDRGRLTGDPRLLTHARLVVELGAVFVNSDPPARVQATLSGGAAPVMLTLAHACDKVISVDFEPA